MRHSNDVNKEAPKSGMTKAEYIEHMLKEVEDRELTPVERRELRGPELEVESATPYELAIRAERLIEYIEVMSRTIGAIDPETGDKGFRLHLRRCVSRKRNELLNIFRASTLARI